MFKVADLTISEPQAEYSAMETTISTRGPTTRYYLGSCIIPEDRSAFECTREINLFFNECMSTSDFSTLFRRFFQPFNQTSHLSPDCFMWRVSNRTSPQWIAQWDASLSNASFQVHKYSSNQITSLIRQNLSDGDHKQAREIANWASQQFPQDEDIQRLAELLAPPKILASNLPPHTKARLNVGWMNTHAQAFKGRWVALENGELRGSADSLKELVQQVGDPRERGFLITKV